jgi:hypothetical protein
MMKHKIFTSIALLFLIVNNSTAQLKSKIKIDEESFFRFGAKVGLNINKITGQSYKSGFNYNFQGGAFVQINFSDRFGIQPEINLVQTSTEFTNDATDIYDDLFRDGSQKKASLNYLEIPILLNINVGESKHVKVQIGPSFGALLSQKIDQLNNNANLYKNNEISGIAGLWIQLPVVNIGARYKIGFTDINAIDNKQTWKNQAIQIFVGVTF